MRSFVENPRQRNLQYLKRSGGVFLKSHIFALSAGFFKRSCKQNRFEKHPRHVSSTANCAGGGFLQKIRIMFLIVQTTSAETHSTS